MYVLRIYVTVVKACALVKVVGRRFKHLERGPCESARLKSLVGLIVSRCPEVPSTRLTGFP